MATGRLFQEVELPEQRSYDDGLVFPVVLSPTTKTNIIQCIRSEKLWLESLLQKRGVILFRGFPVTSPSDFNDVVEAFDFPELLYVGGRAPRTKVVGRVYTANDSPLDKIIPFHHEMASMPDFPSKLFFFCAEEPKSGGETPILLSHIVYEKMKAKHPDFVAQLEEHGLTNTKIMSDEDRPSIPSGRGWKSTFMTDDKNVAEERAAKLGTKLEWIGNAAKVITGPLPAIRLDKGSQRKTWFNNLVGSNTAPIRDDIDDYDAHVELGNGDLLPDHAVKDCMKIMEEECVAIPWKKGDVMLGGEARNKAGMDGECCETYNRSSAGR
ncbi:hypothetical protein M8C21_029257 [Ambrosia artemisiifolia]|uniref:TauD/TfdA-like domain-containing protein n=1 Tax=Ambrosia artemisiifolia TaxID=4212 RepID=A0AAD5CGT9_AMBAR|nr:hypothetical protein M8C21_029257 [Ambrosia artemisiifolia]